jgi:hypothetical protein
MNLTSFTISRGLRLALLLLLLTSQGIANAHALGDSHSLETDNCATCIIGHGLGAAVGDSYEVPPAQIAGVLLPRLVSVSVRVARNTCHFARAPPASSWKTHIPN